MSSLHKQHAPRGRGSLAPDFDLVAGMSAGKRRAEADGPPPRTADHLIQFLFEKYGYTCGVAKVNGKEHRFRYDPKDGAYPYLHIVIDTSTQAVTERDRYVTFGFLFVRHEEHVHTSIAGMICLFRHIIPAISCHTSKFLLH